MNEDLRKRIDSAIAGHGMWKARLRKAIETKSIDLPLETIRSDRKCAFGIWLHEDAFDQNLKDAHYEKVVELHAAFHIAAAEVVENALKGRTSTAQSLMDRNGHFADCSASLTLAMMAWRKEKC